MTSKEPSDSTEEDQKGADRRRAAGEFVRGTSGFRFHIGEADFPAEPKRYHLFVALNCPWCHRVTTARHVLGLAGVLTMDIAFPNRTADSDPDGAGLWEFAPNRIATLTGQTLPECTAETGTGKGYRMAKTIYEAEGSQEKSLPILYDKISARIVSNESAEILRMLDANAPALGSDLPQEKLPKLYPNGPENEALRDEIDRLNTLIYNNINNGAYKAGFSSDQQIYAKAYANYFETLSYLNDLLARSGHPFLTGDTFTEADLRLYPTLFRHDPVYHMRMKLNGARILDYPHLWRWLCRVYAMMASDPNDVLTHCRQGYFGNSWNNVVPLGPFAPMTYPKAYEHPDLAG